MLKIICYMLFIVQCAGCSTYESATVEEGVISNPTVGWNGYSIKVPDGMTVFNPATAQADSASLTDFQRWYLKEDKCRGRADFINSAERFLIEDKTCLINFATDTYSLSSGWGAVTSVESSYLLGKIANRKKVEINDDDAVRTEIMINGQKGWHVSGTSKPYFKKEYVPLAYEGYFIIGTLREAFWIEGYADEKQRAVLKKKVWGMVNSLQIN